MRLNFLRPAGSSWLCLLLFLMAGPSAVADSLLNGLIAPAADPAASRNSIGWQRPVNPNAATVAIMIVGKIDFHSADIAAGWKPWVVNPLAQHGHSSHAFICSHDYPKGGSDGGTAGWSPPPGWRLRCDASCAAHPLATPRSLPAHTHPAVRVRTTAKRRREADSAMVCRQDG